ncbi:unnamed protein product [Choristocarpus tenellus]
MSSTVASTLRALAYRGQKTLAVRRSGVKWTTHVPDNVAGPTLNLRCLASSSPPVYDAQPGSTWTWSTPTPRRPGRGPPVIPIKPRVLITIEEAVKALEENGAADVRVVNLENKSDMGEAMIFCTGQTVVQMRRLADIFVQALKKRKLVRAMGYTGAEGYDCDDWILIDCDNIIVHVMSAEARVEYALEEHWENMPDMTTSELQLRLDQEAGEDSKEGIDKDLGRVDDFQDGVEKLMDTTELRADSRVGSKGPPTDG